jgi:hypothetical protein
MPNYTKHYNLEKPFQEEFYNVDVFNENADIVDGILKELSEKSGVVISPDEPDKGDVWIDTDEEGSDTGGAVESVNGKIGVVILNPSDIDAAPENHTHNISEITGLNGESYKDHTHTANQVTAGTFAGQVVANNSGQTPSSYVLRNSKLSTTEEVPTVNGQICWLCE